MQNFYEYLLTASVAVPLLCGCVLAIFPLSTKASRLTALIGFIIPAMAALFLWEAFDKALYTDSGFAFLTSSIFSGDLLPLFGLNGLSLPMFVLAGIVGLAAGLWALAQKNIESFRMYAGLMLIMSGGLMGAFASVNTLWMYMFHEFALVPTFIAMCVWGGQGRRTAAMEMAVYLTLGALAALVGLIMLFINSGSFNLIDMMQSYAAMPPSEAVQDFIFPFLLFGLGTLVSLFPFHSWAPRTYAAAPTSFAMLHAGVLKKFGLYMLLQVALPLLPLAAKNWAGVLAALALCNVVVMGLVTMAQRDVKMMVSYSSVSHMGICFLGIASMSVLGAGGAVLMMFGHGLSVALLFMLSNALVNRLNQWNMQWMGGVYSKMPVLACFFVAAILATIGLPGFVNFWGELSVLVALWKFSPAVCAAGALGLIISAIYGLRAVAWIFMGKADRRLEAAQPVYTDLTWQERIPAILLVAALVFVGVFPDTITSGLDEVFGSVRAFAVNIK